MIWKGVKKQMRLIGNEKKVGVGKEQARRTEFSPISIVLIVLSAGK